MTETDKTFFCAMRLDWDALPTTPPSHYIIFKCDGRRVALRLRTPNDWEKDISLLDRKRVSIYDVSLLGLAAYKRAWWQSPFTGNLIGLMLRSQYKAAA